ncbi:MAG: AraC family transcriptional regulator [Clostridia bacterium]
MAFIEIDKFDRFANYDGNNTFTNTFYQIVYIGNGEKEYTIENKLCLAKANSFVLIPPSTKYSYKNFSGAQLHISFDVFYLDIIDEVILHHCFNNRIIHLDMAQQCGINLVNMVKEIEKEYNMNIKQDNLLLKLLVSELVLRINRYALENDSLTLQLSNSTCLMEDIRNYINNNFASCTLASLSKTFYVSTSHLSREFKKMFEINISDFIISKKIALAINLLRNTKQSMEQIATECGFSSANYFGLRFKQEMGMSPMAYQKSVRFT